MKHGCGYRYWHRYDTGMSVEKSRIWVQLGYSTLRYNFQHYAAQIQKHVQCLHRELAIAAPYPRTSVFFPRVTIWPSRTAISWMICPTAEGALLLLKLMPRGSIWLGDANLQTLFKGEEFSSWWIWSWAWNAVKVGVAVSPETSL